ncbi:MAG: sulfatase [Candidatus Zhuqueibacterota bacterium]
MDRRQFLRIAGQGIAASSLSPLMFQACDSMKRRPNILFIMTDDHAYQSISCYGSHMNQTPQIDRLARDGVRFEQSYVTNSICAPSRAVLLTGKYSHINGHVDNRNTFDGSQPTFPKLLQQAGFQTAMVGKWHLKSDPTGFDYWNILPDQGQYYNPDFIEMGVRQQIHGYATDVVTDIALDWLEKRDRNRPFCLLLHHKAPHRNWMPALKYLNKYEDVEIPMPETFFDDYVTRSDAARQQEMEVVNHTFPIYDLKGPLDESTPPRNDDEKADRDMWKAGYNRMTEEQKNAWDAAYGPRNKAYQESLPEGRDLARWKYQRYIKDYLRCVDSVDENIGRVLDYLDNNDLAENTIVVYTSDQGFYLGEHGWFDKRFMYEQSLRMPLIIRYPARVKPAVNSSDMVMNLDFAPTFLDFAGVAAPADMQGRSLRRVLTGKTPSDWRQSIYYHYYEYPAWHMVKRHYGVRTHEFKLIHFYYDIDAWELYDLKKDPHELNNVYDDPAYADKVVELKAELERLRKFYGDSDDNKFMPKATAS